MDFCFLSFMDLPFPVCLSRWDRSADEPPTRRHRGRPRPTEVREAGPTSLRARPGPLFGHSQTQHPTVQQLRLAVCLKGRLSLSFSLSLSLFLSLFLLSTHPSFSPFRPRVHQCNLLFCHFLLLCVGFSPPFFKFNLIFFCFTHRGDGFVVTACHAEVTSFSHSPALKPAAVCYLVGTVTSHVTYVYIRVCRLSFETQSRIVRGSERH